MNTTPEVSRDVLESKIRLYRRLTIALAVVSVFLIVTLVGQLTLNNPATATATPSASSTATAEDPAQSSADSPIVRRDPDDPMAIGAVDAPIVLIQWTDLRCPFCAAFHRDTLPALIQEYVDSGEVRVEIHDVAFFGEESADAAIAARAAGNQSMFVEYLDTVYDAAPEGGHPDMPREKLIDFARTAGVPDIAKFTADLDDPTLRAATQESTATAQSIGVNAVPFFVVGTTALSGAQPVDVFRDFLDKAIEQAG